MQAGPGFFCGVGQGCQQEPYSRAHSSRIANGGWNYHLAFSAVSPLVDSLVVSWNLKADAETAASNNTGWACMDDADHVDGAAIGQQADMVRMSVDVSCSDAPQVLVRTHDGCRRCAGNTKERHTCGKRRAPPQGVATASRPSRQRTGKTDEPRATTVILLPTESTADKRVGSASVRR